MLLRKWLPLFVFLLPSLLYGTTWYVDNACPNNGDGTAQSCAASPGAAGPFNSIANVQSAVTGDQHGNSVLLKSGETFREAFTNAAYGTNGGRFVIWNYGSGALPVVSGADALSGWSSQNFATYNWASEDSGFNRNDTSGYTYAVTGGGSGSVSQANMRLSMVNGTAFVDFGVANVLTSYLGHLLTVTDHSSKHATGYITTAGTGETYGAELNPYPNMDSSTGFTYSSATGAVQTSNCQAGNCLQLTLTGGYGDAAIYGMAGTSAGMLLKNSIYIKTGTEAANLNWSLFDSGAPYNNLNTLNYIAPPAAWTQYILYGTVDAGNGVSFTYQGVTSGKTSYWDTASNKQVLTPSSTGVTIASSTAQWTGYYVGYSTAPTQVFEDGLPLAQNVTSASSMSAGQYYLDTVGKYAWVRTFNSDNPSGHTVEASVRTSAITMTATPYVTLQGIDAEKSAADNIDINGVSSYFIANGIKSNYATYSGIVLNAPAVQGTPLQSAIIENSTFSWDGEKGIAAGGNNDSLLIQGNSIDHFCIPYPGAQFWCGGIYIFSDANGAGGTPAERPTNVIAQNNTVYSGGVNSLENRGFGIWFDTLGAGSQIRYNYSHDNSMNGIQLEYPSDVSSTWVEAVIGNLSINNGTGISLARHSHNSIVAGNTVWGNWYTQIYVSGDSTSENIGMLNNTISNNIAFNVAGVSLYSQGFDMICNNGGENDGTNGHGNVYTYNSFGVAATSFMQWGATLYGTYAAWEGAAGNCGSGGCSHSVQTNPTFANAAGGQFWQTVGSSGIASGTALGSPYNIGIQPGSSWPYNVFTVPNTNNDLGAFPYTETVIDSVTGSGTQASGTTR